METVTVEPVMIESQGARLAGSLFEAGGRLDRAVIIAHGAFEQRENWADYAGRLAGQGFTTLTFDFTGHGESEGQRGLVEMRAWAYNIRDAMNALTERGVKKFALVGWGSGGSAALVAAAHDKRVACAAVLAAPVQISPPLGDRTAFVLAGAASRPYRWIKKKPLTFSRVKEYTEVRLAIDDGADAAFKNEPRLLETLRAVPVPGSLDSVWVDITRSVGKIKAPVLIVHGTQDEVVPFKQSELLKKLLQGRSKLCLVEDAGHALHVDHKKDEVYAAVAAWVKKYLREA